MKRTFKTWTPESFIKLYTAYVRPQVEYCAALWNPHLKKDINCLERVQHRATKLVPQIRHLPYLKRLSILGLQTLEERRIRGDLIQYYKIDKSFNKVNWYHPNPQMYSLSTSGPANNLRGHNHRIARQFTKNNRRENFFSNRIVPHWNKLPNEVVEANTLNVFKNRIDKYFDDINKKNFATLAGFRELPGFVND